MNEENLALEYTMNDTDFTCKVFVDGNEKRSITRKYDAVTSTEISQKV